MIGGLDWSWKNQLYGKDTCGYQVSRMRNCRTVRLLPISVVTNVAAGHRDLTSNRLPSVERDRQRPQRPSECRLFQMERSHREVWPSDLASLWSTCRNDVLNA